MLPCFNLSNDSFEQICLDMDAGIWFLRLSAEGDPKIRKMVSSLFTNDENSTVASKQNDIRTFKCSKFNDASFCDSAAFQEGFSPFRSIERYLIVRSFYFLILLDLVACFYCSDPWRMTVCEVEVKRNKNLAEGLLMAVEQLSLIDLFILHLMYVCIEEWERQESYVDFQNGGLVVWKWIGSLIFKGYEKFIT